MVAFLHLGVSSLKEEAGFQIDRENFRVSTQQLAKGWSLA